MRLLLVEDEDRLAEALCGILQKSNYGVDIAADGITGQELAETGVYDLIILDRMLPGKEGLEVVSELRRTGIQTPVLVLTARDAVEDRVAGLDAGADDYLIKPFSSAELLARIRALGRRPASGIQNEILCISSCCFTPRKGEVEYGPRKIKLTQKESQILELFMRNPNQVITKEQLLDKVWGFASDTEMNSCEVYLSFLRKKLKKLQCPVSIETVRGIGYCLHEGHNHVQ